MNLAGIPPFSGFIGKLGRLEAGIADGGWLPIVLVAGGAVTSLLTLLAISRVWSRAFWRLPAQSPVDDTDDAAAADAGPELAPAPVPGGADEQGSAEQPTGTAVGGGRAEARRAAWERHTAVATATVPVTDGLGDGDARERPLRPLPRVMVGSTAAMVAVTVALTVLAGPLYGVAERAADDLRDRSPYISAVFGGEDVP
jgi:multicomponent Na+:H+ antiporter subunit D